MVYSKGIALIFYINAFYPQLFPTSYTPLALSDRIVTLPPLLILQLLHPLDQPLSQIWTQLQNAVVGAHPIRPTLLVVPVRPDERPPPIHLEAPEDVLRPRDAAVVGRVALVADVHPAAPARAALRARPARARLRRRPLRAADAAGPAGGPSPLVGATAVALVVVVLLRRVVRREEQAAAAQRRAGLRGVGGGLRVHVRVVHSVRGDDGLQDAVEGGVFAEGVGRGRDGGGGAEGEGFDGWCGRGEGEGVVGGYGVGVDVLVGRVVS